MLPPSTNGLPEQPLKKKSKSGKGKPNKAATKPEDQGQRPAQIARRARGAALYAMGKTHEEIAAATGASPATVYHWTRHPEFRQLAQRHLAEMRSKVMSEGIALKEKRLAALDDRWRRCQTVIEERAMQPGMDRIPGGRTGLLMSNLKTVGVGRGAEVAREYQVDCDLLREMRELEAAAAAEMGHRTAAAGVTVQPVMLVMSHGQSDSSILVPQQRLAGLLPESARPQLPGVVIDLVPDRNGSNE